VISSPLILPAGRRIISAPGYDKDTGLFFEPLGASFPAISTNPTRDDALAALALLMTLLEEFPFADGQRGANESTMLSAIVSAIMRAALGNVPLHAFNAPQARTGKSLAATLVSIIAQGRLPALCTAGKNEEELEKRIDAMLLWSPPFFVIDNINYPLESASLCVLLTQEEKRIRPLGTSDFPEITSRPFVECTGNNLALVGDLTGRSIRCTIDAKCERPEFRPIKRRSLLLDVKKDRARYAAAALTIVQAFLCAGAPPQAEPLGFFEKWSLYDRDALIWLGCADACETMEAIRADDPKRNDLARLMKVWWRLFHSEPHTAREAIANATLEYDGVLAHPDLNDALMQVARARAGGGLDGLRLSGWLRRHKRVVTGGKYFDRDPLDDDWGAARWALLEGSAPKDTSRDAARRASDVSDVSDVFSTHA
jgi:putative DNA primase/helicase